MRRTNFSPRGILFKDEVGREFLLVTEGWSKDWICCKHPDGQWVTLEKATPERIAEITAAMR